MKGRAWLFEVYPESAPDGWEIALTQTGLAWARGPLHDKDVWPGDHQLAGQTKKPHWHCCVAWPKKTNTTLKHVKEMIKELCNSSAVIPCASVPGSVNYWSHNECSNKAQYDPDDIKFFNGFDPDDLAEVKKENERIYVSVIKGQILKSGLFHLWDVDEYLENQFEDTDPEIIDYFRSHSIYWDKMLYSLRKTRGI